MRTPILMLGLLALLVHALDCEQVYVRVQYPLSPMANIQQAYSGLNTLVNNQVNTYCICSNDTPEFDAFSTCWQSGCTPPVMICGFRLWRVRKTCNIATTLNNYFTSQTSLWQVYDTQSTGDVHCGDRRLLEY
jgi:hypothetical protein